MTVCPVSSRLPDFCSQGFDAPCAHCLSRPNRKQAETARLRNPGTMLGLQTAAQQQDRWSYHTTRYKQMPRAQMNQHCKERCRGCGLWKFKVLDCTHCITRPNRAQAAVGMMLQQPRGPSRRASSCLGRANSATSLLAAARAPRLPDFSAVDPYTMQPQAVSNAQLTLKVGPSFVPHASAPTPKASAQLLQAWSLPTMLVTDSGGFDGSVSGNGVTSGASRSSALIASSPRKKRRPAARATLESALESLASGKMLSADELRLLQVAAAEQELNEEQRRRTQGTDKTPPSPSLAPVDRLPVSERPLFRSSCPVCGQSTRIGDVALPCRCEVQEEELTEEGFRRWALGLGRGTGSGGKHGSE